MAGVDNPDLNLIHLAVSIDDRPLMRHTNYVGSFDVSKWSR